MHDFLDLLTLDAATIMHLLREAIRLKAEQRAGVIGQRLRGKVVALAFEKPSLRTRVSFEAGVAQLGGTSLFLPAGEVGLGTREPLADFARTMSEYVDALVMRVFQHSTVEQVAKYASIPVINGLSDQDHPCQAMADLLTILECFGDLTGLTVAFVGDGNNVARSLAIGCGKMGMRFVLARPDGYGFDAKFLAQYAEFAGGKGLEESTDPRSAVKSADVVYTDVWTSMGQETEQIDRLFAFAKFQVNDALMSHAQKHVKVLHCLPAHRGEEISHEVMEGPMSVVFQQAGNRLHAQKAVLEWIFNSGLPRK